MAILYMDASIVFSLYFYQLIKVTEIMVSNALLVQDSVHLLENINCIQAEINEVNYPD